MYLIKLHNVTMNGFRLYDGEKSKEMDYLYLSLSISFTSFSFYLHCARYV